MKKVLHAALLAPNYSNKGIMDGFFGAGFKEYKLFDYFLHRFNTDQETMQKMLVKEAEDMKPDLIWMQVQVSDIIDAETFKALSKIAFTVNYTFDIRHKEQTEWLYNLVPHIGLMCFSNQRDVDECKSRGYNNVMVLQSSVDMDVYKPNRFAYTPNFVSFIGTNFAATNMPFPQSDERVEMVDRLRKRFGKSFDVWGRGWGESQSTFPGQEAKIYDTSLMGINHNNFNEELYTSDRLWRIMASGVMCLTSYFKGLETLFTRGKDIDWWETLDELEEKIDYYFSNPDEAANIAFNGCWNVRANHKWENRIMQMRAFIESMGFGRKADNCLKMGAHTIDGVIPQAFDEHLAGKPCDCGALIGSWEDCGCTIKEYQFRWKQNI